MTTDLILDQLIIDRRQGLARRRPRRRTPVAPAAAAPRVTLHAATPSGPEVPEPTAVWATSLAHRVAEHGLGGNEAAIAQLVRTARRLQLSPVLTDALSDRALADVVRERAMGRLLASVAGAAEIQPAAIEQVA